MAIINYRSVCTEGIDPSDDLSGALLLPAGASLHPLSLQLDLEETTLTLLSPPSVVVQSSPKGFCPLQDNNDDLLVSSVPWCSVIGSRLPYRGHHRYPRSSSLSAIINRSWPVPKGFAHRKVAMVDFWCYPCLGVYRTGAVIVISDRLP